MQETLHCIRMEIATFGATAAQFGRFGRSLPQVQGPALADTGA